MANAQYIADTFARARALEASVGIGRRRIYCDAWTYRQCDNMPYSNVAAGSPEFGR